MAKEIKMPKGGATSETSLISKWCKKEGDFIKKGDILFEIETDKAILGIESFAEGYLLKKMFEEYEEVKVGEIVAYIGEQGESLSVKKEENKESVEFLEDDFAPIMEKERIKRDVKHDTLSNEIKATPKARHYAKSKNIDLHMIENKASDIIYYSDVEYHAKQLVETSFSNRTEINKMRETIASRMKTSLNISAPYSVSIKVNATELVSIKEEFNSDRSVLKDEIKISYNDILMYIISRVILKVPIINAYMKDEYIQFNDEVNFGLAVSLDEGLLVPVVTNCQKKTLLDIARINSKNITNIRNGNLTEVLTSSGTITLSNLGMFGVTSFTSIINQPESSILSIGSIIKEPIVKDGEIVINPMMVITGTFDHRIIDGAKAAEFLSLVKSSIENPRLLMLF